MVTEVGTSTGF